MYTTSSSTDKAWLHLSRSGQHQSERGPDSDVSSQDAYGACGGGCPNSSGAAAALRAPSAVVAAQLSSAGGALLATMRGLASALLAQSTLWPSAAAARDALASLQELHSCIVALDDALDEAHVSGGVAAQLGECRAWLKAAQGFVLALNKQLQGFCEAAPMDASSADALSSMEEGSCSSSSAASLEAWRSMCADAADALTAVVVQVAAGGAEDGARAHGAAAAGPGGRGGGRGGSRLVAQTSRLSYSTHWSQKIAI